MLVLASSSPRRQELLRNAGIPFTVQPADIDETPRAAESAQACAERLAREKALAVQREHPDDFVLGADTVVVLNGLMLGKPRDDADAERMLRLLSGKTHAVITGVCLAGPDAFELTTSETTLVTMCEISAAEIHAYISTREPMDKAGAYAIQGIASRWIPSIEGDYSNVVGLPVARVYSLLRENGAL
jgi:septum formation protein